MIHTNRITVNMRHYTRNKYQQKIKDQKWTKRLGTRLSSVLVGDREDADDRVAVLLDLPVHLGGEGRLADDGDLE